MAQAACHPDRKLVGRGLCRACYSREYRGANAERIHEQERVRYAADVTAAREKTRVTAQARRLRDPEGVRRKARNWRLANLDHVLKRDRAVQARRRASCVAHTKHPATAAERAALVAPGEMCLYCEEAQATHVDHFIPIARWATADLTDAQREEGPDHINNLVPACAACNSSKGARLPDVEWKGRR